MRRPRRQRCRASGFTLVEALLAMLFMAVVVPVIMNAFLASNRAAEMAGRTRLATQLADLELTELIVADTWRGGDTRGDFGPDYPGFRWQARSTPWEKDNMTRVEVTVFFQLEGTEFHVEVATLAETAST